MNTLSIFLIRFSFPCLEWAAWFQSALQCSTACTSSTTRDWSWNAWPPRNTSSPPQSSTWTWLHSSCACWNSAENAKDATIRLKTVFPGTRSDYYTNEILFFWSFVLMIWKNTSYCIVIVCCGFNVLCFFFFWFVTAANWHIVLFWYCIFSVLGKKKLKNQFKI